MDPGNKLDKTRKMWKHLQYDQLPKDSQWKKQSQNSKACLVLNQLCKLAWKIQNPHRPILDYSTWVFCHCWSQVIFQGHLPNLGNWFLCRKGHVTLIYTATWILLLGTWAPWALSFRERGMQSLQDRLFEHSWHFTPNPLVSVFLYVFLLGVGCHLLE